MSTYYLEPTAKQNKKPHHHLAGFIIYNEYLGILGIHYDYKEIDISDLLKIKSLSKGRGLTYTQVIIYLGGKLSGSITNQTPLTPFPVVSPAFLSLTQ